MHSAVIVVGAGPVGLMLAGELRLNGVDVTVFEQRTTPTGESRGIGFTARAMEVFDQRGLLSRFGRVELGQQGHFGGVHIDFNVLADNHFGARGVPQYRIERGLEEWALELGATIRRGHTMVDLRQSDDLVTAIVEGPDGQYEHTADYLVGCDGGRSTVRRLVGIDFPGTPATRGMYLADLEGVELRPRYIGERVPNGMVMVANLEGGITRITIHEDQAPPPGAEPPTFAEIADTWQRLTGESIHHGRARWISSFTDSTRQAEEYRSGRVFLAGDAAHIHLPAGAQGLSVGVQDAVNLGWKLAGAIQGWAPEGLLDTYHSERHPVGTRLLRNTLAQGLLYLSGDEMEPLRSVLRELMTLPDAARTLAGMVSGLDIRYDVGPAEHELLGTRMPDLWLEPASGARTRIREMLRPGRALFIDVDAADPAGEVAAGWSDRIDVVTGTWVASDAAARPEAARSVLIRPDGYVVWVSGAGEDLTEALRRWFGPARSAPPAPVPVRPKLTPFLAFQSGAEEAMNLYTSLFPDSAVLSTIRAREGEPGWVEGTLQHAVFTVAGQHLMCINMPPEGARGHDHAPWHELHFNAAVALYVQCGSEAEIDRLFERLSEGGAVLMPLGSYGYSAKFGWVTDRYGVSWRLNLSA